MRPDFDDLLDESVPADEREELRQIHDLLLSADPPPSFAAPRPVRRGRPALPRRWALPGLVAAGSAAVGLALGYALGHGAGFHSGFTRSMHGVGNAAAASALIKVGNEDADGNRSLRVTVQALPALSRGGRYELDLTRKGKVVFPCGAFRTGASGAAQVSMNAPADLAEYGGWIVTALVPGQAPRVLLST
jgi:hypothetical protein